VRQIASRTLGWARGAGWLLAAAWICAPAAADLPAPLAAMVAEARRSVPLVGVDALQEVVEGRRPGLLIDVREPAEFADGHLPGAINIPRGLVEFRIWDQVGYPEATDFDRPLYLYCKSASRALLAARSLRELGFRHAYAADMTLAQWLESGGELVESEP